MLSGITSAVPAICSKCGLEISGIGLSGTTVVIGPERYHLGCAPGRSVDDNSLRLRRIERDMRLVEEELREYADDSKDGYLLGLADSIRKSLA